LFQFPFDETRIPLNGIYILFEKGELAHGTNRIVRVGTHTGKDQLRLRLKQHFVAENKDRSIFRKNIGRSLLHKENDSFLMQWEIDLTTRSAKEKYASQIDREKRLVTEQRVTRYIQESFSFVVLRIDDKYKRLELESKIISTISFCQDCQPSENWLGRFSPKERIRESGLWLVNELYKEPLSNQDFQELSKIANEMYRGDYELPGFDFL
jgi:hypothetical protein